MQRTGSVLSSRIGIIVLTVLLLLQGVGGILLTLPLLSHLLAPGSPVIVTGSNIFTGPLAGIALVVALASFIVPWGWWAHQHGARVRIILLEGISVLLGLIGLIDPHLSLGLPLARLALAAIILLGLLVASLSVRGSQATVSHNTDLKRSRVTEHPSAPVALPHSDEKREQNPRARIAVVGLWVLGLLTLLLVSVLTRHHPGPWPIELASSRAIQHINYPQWIPGLLDFIGTFDNPTPTGIVIGGLLTALLLIGWYRQTLFLALAVGIGNGLNALIGDYVQRPRPSPHLIHVDVILKYNSFPSGHTCHMMVFYGFILYLTLTKAVRRSSAHWLLLPVQAFALLNIMLMGYSRLYEGEHWLGDVMGGYLSGTLWLVLFIFLYQLATVFLERRRARRAESALPAQDTSQRQPTTLQMPDRV